MTAGIDPRYSLSIERSWNDLQVAAGERCAIRLQRSARELRIEIDAPFHDDPPPKQEPGRCEGLWNFEAVELFLVGPDRYLELEFGPHGHFLALELRPVRRRIRDELRIRYPMPLIETRPPLWAGGLSLPRWRAQAIVANAELPETLVAANAFALHGRGARRRYLAACPIHDAGDREPDFHRVDRFPSLESFASGEAER